MSDIRHSTWVHVVPTNASALPDVEPLTRRADLTASDSSYLPLASHASRKQLWMLHRESLQLSSLLMATPFYNRASPKQPCVHEPGTARLSSTLLVALIWQHQIHCIILYCIIFYGILLYFIVLYFMVFYYILLYCIITCYLTDGGRTDGRTQKHARCIPYIIT